LLNTAGLSVGRGEDDFTDELDMEGHDENSPSVVRKVTGFEDESF